MYVEAIPFDSICKMDYNNAMMMKAKALYHKHPVAHKIPI